MDPQIEVWINKTWHRSPKGTLWQEIDGYNVAVLLKADNSWSARLKREHEKGNDKWGNGFNSERAAKIAVLEEILAMKQGQPGHFN